VTTKNHRTIITVAGVIAVAVVSLAAALAGAAEPTARAINETRAVEAKARISIENLAGLIDVSGWDRNEVQITGTLDEQAKKLEIEGSGNLLNIAVRYPQQHNLNIKEGTRLTIKVPRGCELDVESVSAEVKVAEVVGAISAESVSGDVMVRGAPAELDVDTVSGEIDIEVAGARATLASVSGDILARGVGDQVEATTVSGEIEITAAGPLAELTSESVSGSMTVVASPADRAQWSLSAHSGNIDLTVPAGVNASFAIETFSGSLHDGFGHEANRTDEHAPGRELEFTQGSGSAKIEIESFSGDVEIRKQ
jgi:DUF4097 and DUF4098 domain-containing protein YvlB